MLKKFRETLFNTGRTEMYWENDYKNVWEAMTI